MSVVQNWMDTVCRALRISVDAIHLEGLISKAFDIEGGFPLLNCNFFLSHLQASLLVAINFVGGAL